MSDPTLSGGGEPPADPLKSETGRVSVRLFGGAAVLLGGAPIGGQAAHRHRLALLAVLATGGRPVSRDKLIALLWPERDTESARNLLKVALHALRKLLGEGAIRSIGDQLATDETALTCDVMEFESALRSGAYERAVREYTGPFIDGFHLKEAPDFERLVEAERARLAQAYHSALEQVAAAAEGRGDFGAAVPWWRKLAGLDPVRADVALRLMRALAASGDTAGAIRHGEIHARLSRELMDLEPNAAVTALGAEIRTKPAAWVTRMAPSGNVGVSASGPGGRKRWWGGGRGVVLAGGLAAIAAAGILLRSRGGESPEPAPSAAVPVTDGGALLFAGTGFAATARGRVATAQLDDVALDLMVRYDGSPAFTEPTLLFYNGNAAFSGWGVLALPPDSTVADGTIAVLAGGVAMVTTPLVLRRGVWQHLVVSRRDGRVTLTLDDLSFSAGALVANRLGGAYVAVERTALGGNISSSGATVEGFRGAIARAGIRDLANGYWIERWDFGEGTGPTATGERGTVLSVVHAKWLGGGAR